MPLMLAQSVKAFACELYTLPEEFRRGFAAISTTVSGKWWLFKTSLIISTWLDPIAVDLGDIGGVWSWAHTGTGWRPGEEFKDVRSTVEEAGATAWMDVVTQSWWPWFPEIFGFSGELSQTDPGDRTVPGSCKTGTETVFPLFADVRYCCTIFAIDSHRLTSPLKSQWSSASRMASSWYDMILELTIVPISDGLSNWCPIPWGMHP